MTRFFCGIRVNQSARVRDSALFEAGYLGSEQNRLKICSEQNRLTTKSARNKIASLQNLLGTKSPHYKICSEQNRLTTKSARNKIASLQNLLGTKSAQRRKKTSMIVFCVDKKIHVGQVYDFAVSLHSSLSYCYPIY